jgi:hypothetical protein
MPLFDTVVEDKNEVIGYKLSQDGITTLSFSPKYDCVGSFELKTRYQTTTAFNTTIFDGWDNVATGNPYFADQIFQRGEYFPFVQFDIKDSIEWRNYINSNGADWVTIQANYGDSNLAESLSPKNMSLCYVTFANNYGLESFGYEYRVMLYDNNDTLSNTVVYVPTLIANSNNKSAMSALFRATNSSYESRVKIDGRNLNSSISVRVAYKTTTNKICYPNSSKEMQNGAIVSTNPNAMKAWCISTDQRLTFDVALQMPPQRYTNAISVPISELTFGSSNFGGEGSITVYGSAEGSIKPDFGWGVPVHSEVKLSDIGGETDAESMLRSIMQLYNLLVYTNPKTKQVFLYSFADFWENNVVDWRDRVDADSDISTTYVGDSIGKEILLSFAEGSPRIDYYNDRHKLPYSAFKKALPNKMTTEAKEVQNETLTPPYMVRIKDEFGKGEGFIPAVALPDKEGDVLEFNIADVPNTLMMIDTSDERINSMPPLNTDVFGDVGGIQPSIVATYGDTTLSFSDKDGKVGLHRYYDKQIALWEKAKRLTCYCRVEAWEIEALRYNSKNINFRSLFRLNINGEDIYARLESLEYEPTNATNKCTFIIE